MMRHVQQLTVRFLCDQTGTCHVLHPGQHIPPKTNLLPGVEAYVGLCRQVGKLACWQRFNATKPALQTACYQPNDHGKLSRQLVSH